MSTRKNSFLLTMMALAGHGRRPLAECVTGAGPGTRGQEADRGGSPHRHLGPLAELSSGQVLHAIPGEGERKVSSSLCVSISGIVK